MDQAGSHKKLVYIHSCKAREGTCLEPGGIFDYYYYYFLINSILVLLIKIFTMKQLQQIFYWLGYSF